MIVMRPKNDIAIAATSARSYNRHWRANKLSWTDIGKLKYLFDGAIEVMDEVTLAYTRDHFNQLRKALGFKQDSELTELIERSNAFRIVYNRETGLVEAFMSPLVGDRFEPTANQMIEEPAIAYDIFFCKADALANDNDRDKISENQRQHRKGIDMHVLLAGNVPKFHIDSNIDALIRISNGLAKIRNTSSLNERYFGGFIKYYKKEYPKKASLVDLVLDTYLGRKVAPHMSRRVGIENWPNEAILTWLDYYFGVKRLSKVVTEAHETWQRAHEALTKTPAPNVFGEAKNKNKTDESNQFQ